MKWLKRINSSKNIGLKGVDLYKDKLMISSITAENVKIKYNQSSDGTFENQINISLKERVFFAFVDTSNTGKIQIHLNPDYDLNHNQIYKFLPNTGRLFFVQNTKSTDLWGENISKLSDYDNMIVGVASKDCLFPRIASKTNFEIDYSPCLDNTVRYNNFSTGEPTKMAMAIP